MNFRGWMDVFIIRMISWPLIGCSKELEASKDSPSICTKILPRRYLNHVTHKQYPVTKWWRGLTISMAWSSLQFLLAAPTGIEVPHTSVVFVFVCVERRAYSKSTSNNSSQCRARGPCPVWCRREKKMIVSPFCHRGGAITRRLCKKF